MYFHGFQFHFVSASAIFILIMFVTIGSHVLPLNYIRSTKRSLSFTFAIGISIHLAYTYIFVHMYHLHRVRRVSIGSCYTCFIQVDFCACLLHLMDLDQSILHSCSTDLFTSCFPQYFQLISTNNYFWVLKQISWISIPMLHLFYISVRCMMP